MRLQLRNVTDVSDLHKLIRAKRYKLILLGPIVWETLPADVKRVTGVRPLFCEPDPHALEQIRIAAGVLI